MAFRLLPGDKEVFHRRYTDKFNSWYGEGIDAKQIYICRGSKFVKFHAVFPERSHVREYSRTQTAHHAALYMNEDQCVLVFSLSYSQPTLPAHALHQCSSVAQAHLTTCHTRHKSHLFPSILYLTRPPHLRNQLVTRPDRARKPCRKLLDIRRVAAAKMLQQRVSRCIPAEEAMH